MSAHPSHAARTSLPTILAILLLFPMAQEGWAGGAGLGLAGAYSLSARGVEAPFWNPATLAGHSGMEVQIGSATGAIRNNRFTMTDYGRWNGERWSDADKQEILDRIEQEVRGSFRGSLTSPGIAWNGWALTMTTQAVGRVDVPREYAQFALFGNVPNEAFQFTGARGEAYGYSTVRLTHAGMIARIGGDAAGGNMNRINGNTSGSDRDRTIDPAHDRDAARGAGHRIRLAGGLTLKYVRGWDFQKIERAGGSLQTKLDAVDGEIEVVSRTAGGGNGFAVDAGLLVRIDSGWDIGLSLHNLPGAIWWSDSARRHTDRAVANSLTLDRVEDNVDFVDTSFEAQDLGSFRETLPAEIALAVGTRIQSAHLEANVRQGLHEGPATSTTPRVAVGGRFVASRWIEPRAGVAIGGLEEIVIAAGAGFQHHGIRVDLAYQNLGSLHVFRPKGAALGLSISFRVR